MGYNYIFFPFNFVKVFFIVILPRNNNCVIKATLNASPVYIGLKRGLFALKKLKDLDLALT